jgi:hypothetical protein
MIMYANSHLPRTLRRVSAEAIAHHAATTSQAARLAALGGGGGRFRNEPPAPLWDAALLGRLTVPLSRVRE